MPEVDEAELERLRVAEEVCWTLMLQMGLGLLTVEEQTERDFLAEPLLKWANIAAEQGLMHTHETIIEDEGST